MLQPCWFQSVSPHWGLHRQGQGETSQRPLRHRGGSHPDWPLRTGATIIGAHRGRAPEAVRSKSKAGWPQPIPQPIPRAP